MEPARCTRGLASIADTSSAGPVVIDSHLGGSVSILPQPHVTQKNEAKVYHIRAELDSVHGE